MTRRLGLAGGGIAEAVGVIGVAGLAEENGGVTAVGVGRARRGTYGAGVCVAGAVRSESAAGDGGTASAVGQTCAVRRTDPPRPWPLTSIPWATRVASTCQ